MQIRDTAIPLGSFEKQFKIAEVDLVRLEYALPLVMQLLEGKNIIYSHDADEFADWKARYADSVRLLMSALCSYQGVDLIHFTPSPAYCGPDEAMAQWDLLREVYVEL